MDCVVASDLGSSSCKTVVVDASGHVLAECAHDYPTSHPRPGWAEQDPNDWLNAVHATTSAAMRAAAISPTRVAAYGLVGVTHNAVLSDAGGRALRPSILLFDTRSQTECASIAGRFGDQVFARACNAVSPMWTWPQLRWIRANEPAALRAADSVLFQKDWVRNQLAPSRTTDPIDAAGSLLFDPRAERWIDEFIEDAGLAPSALPTLSRPTDIVARLHRSAANAMGLLEGTPVITGTTDTAAEILGAGATQAGQATVKLASVGRMASVSAMPSEDVRLLNYRHVLDGLWYPGTATKNASSAYAWMRQALGPGTSFEQMSAAAVRSRPGARGVLFLPHLGGEWAPHWDPSMRAAFLGLDTDHDSGDLCRAVMEGVAFALKDATSFARDAGLTFGEFRLLGGGSVSPLWCQILADVLDTTLLAPLHRSAAWGGAVLCGMATGLFRADPTSLRAMMSIEAVFEPRPGDVEHYREIHRLYRDADVAVAPLSRKLASLRERAGASMGT